MSTHGLGNDDLTLAGRAFLCLGLRVRAAGVALGMILIVVSYDQPRVWERWRPAG